MKKLILFLAVLANFGQSCRIEPPTQTEFALNVRLGGEPDRLNPMITNVSYATDILRLTHFPMLEYNPVTLELEPVLAANLPEITPIDTGALAGGQAFRYRIRPEAVWDDGQPITAHDYIFTLKAAFNPHVKATAWRGYLSIIRDVIVDPDDAKQFTVLTTDRYFLSLPATGNFNIYSKHTYDPQGLLDEVPLPWLSDPDKISALAPYEENLLAFAAAFTGEGYARDTALVKGAGPYQLAFWTSGQEIVLRRKRPWWGDPLAAEGNQFQALPTTLRFKIISDEQAALTLFKEGGLDIMGIVSSAGYASLDVDSLASMGIAAHFPQLMQYTFFALNNRRPALQDLRVRKALAHALNMNEVIKTVTLGLGERITGPFHPMRAYYNKSLKPVDFDLEKARKLLQEAGWVDSNNNGILDKIIHGTREELQLTLQIRAGSEQGQQIGLIYQQDLRKIGVKLNIEARDFKLITSDMASRNYDMAHIMLRQSPADDDPYQAWHSDADRPDGSNRYSYRSAITDSLINALRDEDDREKRYDLYRRIHATIYDDQPVIFLYTSKEPLLIRDNVKGLTPSPMRPGYYLPHLYIETLK